MCAVGVERLILCSDDSRLDDHGVLGNGIAAAGGVGSDRGVLGTGDGADAVEIGPGALSEVCGDDACDDWADVGG